jgi:uncharacterized protein involved in outer membrane biogenesis
VTKVRWGRIAAALALAAGAAAAWVALAGIPVDADALRASLARSLGDALGRTVRIEAPVALRVSLWPLAVVRGVAIENPPGFADRDFASAAELALAVDALPLLRGEVRIRELRASGVDVRLRRNAEGTANWTFARAGAPAEGGGPASLPRLDVHRIVVADARVEAPDGFVIEVAELTGEALHGRPARVAVRGVLAGREAWSATLDGAPLDRLAVGEPWTFDLAGAAGGATLAVAGTVTDALREPRVAARIGAGSPDIVDTAARFGIALPPLGAAALGGELAGGGGRWRLDHLTAVVGESTLNGELSLDASGARTRLAGRLALPRLDLAPFFAASSGSAGPPKTLAETFRELERTDPDLRRYARVDTDVAVEVETVGGVPGDLREVSVRILGGPERLALPMRFMLAGARFAGEAAVDVAAVPARYTANLAAGPSPFGGIAEVIFGAPYVDGTIREMRFDLAAEGETLREILHRIAVRGRLAGAALTYGNFAGGAPVRMTIDRADLEQPRGGRLSAKVAGTLIGRPLAGTVQADSLETVIAEGRTRIAFDATSGSVRATVGGRLAPVQDDAGPDLDVRLAARRAAELAPWLGFASTSDVPVDLRGHVQVRRGGTSLLGAAADVGRSSLRGDVIAASVGGRRVLRVALSAERVDLAELQGIASPRDRPRGALVDIPLLPGKLDIGDADFEARVKRIDGAVLRVTDATFGGSLRGGVMRAAPLALKLEDVPLDGAMAADFSGAVPRVELWLQGSDVDVAKWLRALGVGRTIEATAADLRLYADVRDTTVGRALDASTLVANIGQGRFVVRDRNTKAAFRLRVEEGEARADPGEPVRATLKGRIFRAPIELALTTGRLRQFVDGRRMPLDVVMTGAGARLSLSGELAPRVASPDVDLVVGLTGTTFADLAPLFRTSLPPWGPYAGAARLRVSDWGYEVENLRFAVGESVLEGRGALETSRPRPLLTVALDATSIQLDDFAFGTWSPFDARKVEDTRSMAARIEDAAAETGAQVQALLDPELLADYDANLSLDVRQVVSGRDRLGRGRVAAKVEQGGLRIDPVEVEIAGGGIARFDWSYQPRGETIETRARLKAERFDYGVVARRVRPDTDLAGTFSLDLDVAGASPRLAGAIARGSGRIDFAVWPERLHAGVFDLWATNVLLAVLPAMKTDVTRVNCAIGEFDLADGVLTSRRVLIDTTNTRAQGSLIANLPGNSLEARLVPQPKVAQFFALATPIEVTGTLQDFRVTVRPGDVFATAARWATSLVVVPIRKLTETPPPADGSDVCNAPFRAAPEVAR